MFDLCSPFLQNISLPKYYIQQNCLSIQSVNLAALSSSRSLDSVGWSVGWSAGCSVHWLVCPSVREVCEKVTFRVL